MLTEVKAYSSWQSAPALLLEDNSGVEDDLIQITNITGLEPVKASVSSSPFGAVDGSSYTGSSVLERNIVLTVHPNPNWDQWTYETLRRLLYAYFMPKRPTRLVFYSDDLIPVEISGIVESVEVNAFSKDQELQVSIVCPDPYFTAVNPEVITGQSVRPAGEIATIDYNGTVEAGLYVKVTQVSGAAPTTIAVQVGDPALTYFEVAATVNASKYFEASSIPMQKYVQNVDLNTGVIINLLPKVVQGSEWSVLQPGENDFSIITDAGVQDFELTYFERFGGL